MTVRFGTETHGISKRSWWRCAKGLPSHWFMAASGPFPLPGQNVEAREVLSLWLMPFPSYCSFFLLRKSALVWSICHQALAAPTGFCVFLDSPDHSLVSSPHFPLTFPLMFLCFSVTSAPIQWSSIWVSQGLWLSQSNTFFSVRVQPCTHGHGHTLA